ncbi:MAG TPA: MBL fold metallo-hydrolase [Polyangiales bacterium]|nr:MBL fold metallo-hydrolase [Polyangiales bacterium]
MQLSVEPLNHASVLLCVGELRLLSDPWFFGTAFSGGWGLQYDNPDALRSAASATHLWISHWHSDHMHEPSLRALAQENPDLTVLVNESANFSVAERVRALGFKRLITLRERKALELAPGVVVTRYPTAGIDNMLHVQAHGWSVLNYNDCNLRPRALTALAKKLGPIDVLLTHYNHAGKLFELRPALHEKLALWEALCRVTQVLAPRYVIPFASTHYYRSIYSRGQNASLLSFADLQERAGSDPRMLIARVADRVVWRSREATPELVRHEPALAQQFESVHEYGPSVSWEAVVSVARARSRSLQRGFPWVGYLVPPLRVAVTDHGRILELDLRRGVTEITGAAHVAAHSKAIQDWLGRPFGDDTFIAGAHFAVCTDDPATIKQWVALCLLHASRLSLPDLLRYMFSSEGRWFLWCRREEILATLAAGSFSAGELRS